MPEREEDLDEILVTCLETNLLDDNDWDELLNVVLAVGSRRQGMLMDVERLGGGVHPDRRLTGALAAVLRVRTQIFGYAAGLSDSDAIEAVLAESWT